MTSSSLVLLIVGSTRAGPTNTAPRTLAALAPPGAAELDDDLPALPAFTTDLVHDPEARTAAPAALQVLLDLGSR